MNAEIHVDGSIVGGNLDGAGGWAAVVIVGHRTQVVSGCIKASTTNLRAELLAAINAMNLFRRKTNITLYSDSEYLIKPLVDGRIEEWAARNFTKKNKARYGGSYYRERMFNADLWERLNDLDIRHNAAYIHEDGHSKENAHNETCHEHALAMARIAWEAHEKGVPVVNPPSALEAKREYFEILKSCPTPPDPSRVTRMAIWAVFERATKHTFKFGPVSMPMNPSAYPDGGCSYCEKAARQMNQSLRQDMFRKKTLVAGESMFEARPLDAPLDSRVVA